MEIKDIKLIRKRLGLTQNELAKLSGVSQSLIAKIEADKIDPAFSKAKKIFEAITLVSKKQELTADRIMQSRIISAHTNETIKTVIKRMKQYGISQLPVLMDHKVLGLVTESAILNAILKGSQDLTVEDVMEAAPPIVDKNSNSKLVSELLKFYPLVLVSGKGKILGLITKSDILQKVYK